MFLLFVRLLDILRGVEIFYGGLAFLSLVNPKRWITTGFAVNYNVKTRR